MKKVKRPYVLKARARQLAETRTRIVEAIMHLHQEVGPRHTTVSAIAERAGVERLTVYRHFRGESEMFEACSNHYISLNPPPDPATWAVERDPLRRAGLGLSEMYAFFSRTAPMFDRIYRDTGEFASLKSIMDGFDAHLRSIADSLASAWQDDTRRVDRTAILRHAIKFSTWRSLETERVENAQKVRLILEWLPAYTPAPADRESIAAGR